MRKVAYYKGCLASLSAKELDSSTKALAPKVGIDNKPGDFEYVKIAA